MKRKTLTAAIACLATVGLFAGNGNGNGSAGGGNPGGNAPRVGLNLAQSVSVEGVVSSVQIAVGVEYPSITVDKKTIKVAPAWYLDEKDFEIREGQSVRVLAAPSNDPKDPYLHAVKIENQTTLKSITIRDDDGTPLWARGGGRGRKEDRPGNGMADGGCIDLATVKTAAGTIEKVSLGLGLEHPSLTVKLDDGTLLTVEIGPARVVLESDLELKAGSKITVLYAEAPCCDELVALELTVDGKTLVLRDEVGRPAW
jgi:hypothetical protein